jgi:hypothetical protein
MRYKHTHRRAPALCMSDYLIGFFTRAAQRVVMASGDLPQANGGRSELGLSILDPRGPRREPAVG